MSYFQNKVAIITGSSRGIGLSIAKELVANGAMVRQIEIGLTFAAIKNQLSFSIKLYHVREHNKKYSRIRGVWPD